MTAGRAGPLAPSVDGRAELRQSAWSVPDGRLLVQAELRVAAIDARHHRAAGLPRWLLARLASPPNTALPQQGP